MRLYTAFQLFEVGYKTTKHYSFSSQHKHISKKSLYKYLKLHLVSNCCSSITILNVVQYQVVILKLRIISFPLKTEPNFLSSLLAIWRSVFGKSLRIINHYSLKHNEPLK